MYDVIMEKWEYKIISPGVGFKGFINPKIYLKEEQILNELGNNGWELVGIAPFAMDTLNSGTYKFVLIFKRQIKTNVEK